MNPRTTSCPSSEELSDLFSGGGNERLLVHVKQCTHCAGEWAGLTQLLQTGREQPVRMPDKQRLEELRTRMLLAAEAEPAPGRVRPRRLLIAMAAVMLLIAGAMVAALRLGHPQVLARQEHHGKVQTQGAAHFTHAGTPKDEVVRLTDGTIVVDVDHLRKSERFRVVVGEAEVEVRGTRFEVTAEHNRLTRVRVVQGRVEVRPYAGRTTVLSASEQWRAEQTAQAVKAPAKEAAPPPERPAAVPVDPVPPAQEEPALPRHSAPQTKAHRDASPPGNLHPAAAAGAKEKDPAGKERTEKSPAEQTFSEGWKALRAGEYRRAAGAFQRAALLAGDQPLAEDAWYWHGVARARAGQRTDALLSLRAFLDRYPGSPRAGEAQSILGWLYIEEKAYDEAERCFRAAAADPKKEVRESARSGLSALSARRAAQP